MSVSNFSLTLLVMAALWKSSFTGLTLTAKKQVEFELLKRIEIERLKAQILQELGLKEVTGLSGPPAKLPDAVVQMLLSEHESRNRVQNNLARLLFSPTNQNLQCLRHKEESCRRFEYNVPQDMIYKTTEFWMYQIKHLPSENQSISAMCSRSGQESEHLLEQDEFHQDDDNEEEKWLTFHLPMLQQLKIWSGNIVCAIEITGTAIDEKQNLPFLKITQDLEVLSRSRRSEDSPEELEACRPIPFVVFFNEIGFGQHFSYPDSFNANVCKGYCLKSPNFYETIMDLVFTRNSSLEEEYGRCWASRCRPKDFENMDVIFRSKIDGGAVHNVTTLTNIIVKTCTCR